MPVSGTGLDIGAQDRLPCTPGALLNPGPSKTPTTEHAVEVFGGRAASIITSELPTVTFEDEPFDSQSPESARHGLLIWFLAKFWRSLRRARRCKAAPPP